VCEDFGPMGPADLPTHPKKVGDVALSLFKGDCGPLGAVWAREVDDFWSDFLGIDRAQKRSLTQHVSP
jgi:hypothetical protein